MPQRLLLLLTPLMILAACEWKPPRRARTQHEHVESSPPIKTVAPIAVEEQPEQEQPEQEQPEQEQPEQEQPEQEQPEQEQTEQEQPEQEQPEQAQPEQAQPEQPKEPSNSAAQGSLTSSLRPLKIAELGERDYLFSPPEDAEPQVYLKDLILTSRLKYKRPGPEVNRVSLKLLTERKEELISFVRVRNFQGEQKIKMRWVYLGGEVAELSHMTRHKVGISPRWRTWSKLTARRIKGRLGPWRVEVYRRARGETIGELIGLRHFTIAP